MKKIDSKIVRRYNSALLDLYDGKDLDGVRAALLTAAQVWQEFTELRAVLKNPSVPLSEREKIVTQMGEAIKPSDKLFSNFLCILLANSRLEALPQIAQNFSKMVDQIMSVLSFEVVSAFPLSDEEKKEITKKLQTAIADKYRSMTRLAWRVENEIIGGLLIKTGDTMLDSSVRGSLERIKHQLTA